MKLPTTHAPHWKWGGEAACQKEGVKPLEAAGAVTCMVCLKALRAVPQYANTLLAEGWTFAWRELKPRKGKPANPRQEKMIR